MKTIICIAFMMLSFFIVKAQQKVRPVLPFADTSVLSVPPPLLTYKGNSNHFDIYTATPDNIYVIKPDSTIHFQMLTGNYRIRQVPVEKPKEK